MIYTVKNTASIGRYVRVFVNGNECRHGIRADTIRGEVIYVPQPIRAKKGSDEVYTRMLRGKVTVEPI